MPHTSIVYRVSRSMYDHNQVFVSFSYMSIDSMTDVIVYVRSIAFLSLGSRKFVGVRATLKLACSSFFLRQRGDQTSSGRYSSFSISTSLCVAVSGFRVISDVETRACVGTFFFSLDS